MNESVTLRFAALAAGSMISVTESIGAFGLADPPKRSFKIN